jgi:hypothetical protein
MTKFLKSEDELLDLKSDSQKFQTKKALREKLIMDQVRINKSNQ